MPDPTTPAKGLTQPTVGEDNNTWGGLLNTDLSLIDSALGGTVSISISGNITLSGGQAQNTGYEFTGTLSGIATLTWPSFYGFAAIQNSTTAGFSIICKVSGASVTVLNGETVAIWSDGTNFRRLAQVGGGATVSNADLQNSSITIAGHSVSLGGSQNLAASDLTNGTTGSGNVVLATSPSITIAGHTVSLGGSQNLSASDLTNSTTGGGAVVLQNGPIIDSPTVGGAPTFSTPLSVANGGTGLDTYGALDGTATSKGGAYTVTNSDKRSTLVFSSGFYTVTVPSASGFDSDFQIRLYNADGGRGKTIAVSGYSNIILWPNQSVVVHNIGGAWQLYPNQQRWQMPGSQTFYVDPGGNDSNDGLSAGTPFQTVLACWNTIRDYTDGPATIQLTVGASYGSVGELDGDKSGSFGRLIAIVGDPTLVNPSQIICSAGTTGVVLRDGAWVQFNGISFGSSGSSSVGAYVQQKALADFMNCQWASMIGGYHILVQDGADVNITGNQKIAGNAAAHWYIGEGAKLLCGDVTINASPVDFSTAFIIGDMQARIVLQNPALSTNISGVAYALTHGTFLSGVSALSGVGSAGSADSTSLAY